jgi:hypothetical protein
VDCFAALAMTLRHNFAISPRVFARVLPGTSHPQRSEGAGNAGRSMRPQPRMQNKIAYECSHHGHTGITRHSPRNGFNGFLRALPGDRACLPPSSAKVVFCELDTGVGASGPHDFAVRSKRHSSKAPPRPPHPAAHVRDDRETPLERRRDGQRIRLIWVRRQAKFRKFRNYSKRLWRRQRKMGLSGVRRTRPQAAPC